MFQDSSELQLGSKLATTPRTTHPYFIRGELAHRRGMTLSGVYAPPS